MNDFDAYTHRFAEQALETLLGVLESVRPGRLLTFTIGRDEIADRVECTFELDARPGVEFRYYQGIQLRGAEPGLSADTAAGIFFAGILERTAMNPPAVDGRVDLMTVLRGDR
jgi:hypothetical protein